MRFRRYLCSAIILVGMSSSFLNAQTPPAPAATQDKPLLAEQVFKNIQVLKGIPVNEFMDTMGFFAASLSMNCTDCHVDACLLYTSRCV